MVQTISEKKHLYAFGNEISMLIDIYLFNPLNAGKSLSLEVIEENHCF